MATFHNPSNGYEVNIGGGSVLGTFLLGPIWWLIKGAVPAALAYFGLLLLGACFFGVGLLVVHLIATCGAVRWISQHYARQGWVEVALPSRQRGKVANGAVWILGVILLTVFALTLARIVEVSMALEALPALTAGSAAP